MSLNFIDSINFSDRKYGWSINAGWANEMYLAPIPPPGLPPSWPARLETLHHRRTRPVKDCQPINYPDCITANRIRFGSSRIPDHPISSRIIRVEGPDRIAGENCTIPRNPCVLCGIALKALTNGFPDRSIALTFTAQRKPRP